MTVTLISALSQLIPLTQCKCHLKASQLLHFGKQLRRSRGKAF